MKDIKIMDPYIEITSNCNLRCGHCYNFSGNHNPDKLESRTILLLLKELKEMNIYTVSISGGEPLAHRDYLSILEFSKEIGLSTNLITNGTLIDCDNSKEILRFVDTIQISLDGSNSVTQDKLRGKGSFNKSINAIDIISRLGLSKKVMLKMTVSNLNYLESEEMVSIVKQYDLLGISFSLLHRQGRAADDFYNTNKVAVENLKMLKKKIDILIKENISYKIEKLPVTGGGCSLVGNSINIRPRISASGDVFLCQGFIDKKYSVGNIHNNSLREILQGLKVTELLKILYERFEELKQCQSCIWRRNLCEGGCPAEAIQIHGDINQTDGLCGIRSYFFGKELVNFTIGGTNGNNHRF